MLMTRLSTAAILVAVALSATANAQGVQPPAQENGTPGIYPVLNAPLYPAPVQYVPEWSGGTIITNQALAPHEMLYPHTYHSMYGPFYYQVKGHWILTPFGVRQHEQWKLQGTEVKVKYASHYPLLSGFHPPRSGHNPPRFR